jgi:lipoate-protein ligase A
MEFDAGTWWLFLALMAAVTGTLGWMLKRSLDKIEKKLDSAVPKEDFEKSLGDCRSEIAEIQKNYTTKATHEKDFDECRARITQISENYLTKEDFFREQAKTDRKLDAQDKKLDRILELLMQKEG